MRSFEESIVRCIANCGVEYSFAQSGISPFQIVIVDAKKLAFHLVALSVWKEMKNTEGWFFVEMSQLFDSQGIRLVHLWEDVWHSRMVLTEQRIAVMLGKFVRYYARKLDVRQIDNPALKMFLRSHHLQAAIGARHKYGLFSGSEMIAAAAFSSGRSMQRNGKTCRSYELLRFATKMGCAAVGGLGKLVAHFVRTKTPDDIMTYVDSDWGSGDGLRMLGFEQVGSMPPQKFWLDGSGERQYSAAAAGIKNSIVCWNSGSMKFVKIIVK